MPEDRSTEQPEPVPEEAHWVQMAEFTIPSLPGNERLAIDRVVTAVRDLHLDEDRVQRLKTAVGEATMNAMEHGNKYQPDLPVTIRVYRSTQMLAVHITDQGGDSNIPHPDVPDLEAKLAGIQSPRGWGLFLIKNMVDEMRVYTDDQQHTVELILKCVGERDA